MAQISGDHEHHSHEPGCCPDISCPRLQGIWFRRGMRDAFATAGLHDECAALRESRRLRLAQVMGPPCQIRPPDARPRKLSSVIPAADTRGGGISLHIEYSRLVAYPDSHPCVLRIIFAKH